MKPPKIALHGQIEPDLFPEFVVVSDHMRAVIRTVNQIARFDANVLVYGESGTGKELLARIIHQKSNRRDKPFIPVNCGTLSGDLFESKMFGHEVGAFTSAVRQTKGRFEQAHLGTLFLDEVAEISLLNQVSFLRVLEDGCFRRIGAEKPIKVDVRIIAATNKDLAVEVKAGKFRNDLYYRLQVIPLKLRPLRERKEAIPYLANYFLERFATLYQKEKAAFSPGAMESLISHDWPGNVRQLKNLIERVFLTTSGTVIHRDDFPEDFIEETVEQKHNRVPESPEPDNTSTLLPSEGIEPLKKARERMERSMILTALQMTNGQREKAAALLEIKTRTLRQKISDYGIEFRKTRKRMNTKSQVKK